MRLVVDSPHDSLSLWVRLSAIVQTLKHADLERSCSSSSYVLTLTRIPCEHVHCNTRFRSFPARYGVLSVSRIVYFTWELLLPVFLHPFPCVSFLVPPLSLEQFLLLTLYVTNVVTAVDMCAVSDCQLSLTLQKFTAMMSTCNPSP